jgi:DNA invertase Pin-like site-specific DNA recombinase
MFQMLGVFAEFERSMIRERVVAGIARARSQGNRYRVGKHVAHLPDSDSKFTRNLSSKSANTVHENFGSHTYRIAAQLRSGARA